MLREEKERIVSELTERLRGAETLIVADYRGLTMPQIDDLRGKLLEQGVRFTVVKNTLTRRAAEAAGVERLLELIDGPTAIAFIEPEGDPVAAAKVLNDVARVNDVLVLRGGLLEGELVTDAEVKRLASLPPAELLHAQVVGAVAGPLTMVVALFAAPLRELVGVLDARIRQLEAQGGDALQAEAPGEEPVADESAPEPEAAGAAPPGTSDQAPQASAEGGEPAAAESAPETDAPPAQAHEANDEPSPQADQASAEPKEEH